MIYETLGQMKKMLQNLDKWLETAATHAQKKSFDPNVFVTMRLAPDQFAFARQVQAACDTPKIAAGRLSGKQWPANEDHEKTVDELRARIASTLKYLDGFTAKDFEGAETRTISNPRWEGKTMLGRDYFQEHSVPNFYFHLVHAYAILRHNGVDLGKKDYLGPLSLRGS